MKKQTISIVIFLSPYLIAGLLIFLSNVAKAQFSNKGALVRKANQKYCKFIRDKQGESNKIVGGN